MLFYYGSANVIGNIFPEDLGNSLSFNAVSLVVLVVSNAFVMSTLANCKLVAPLHACRGLR